MQLYNGPSGAEKAYKNVIRKLKQHLRASLWPVAGYPEDASEGEERSDGGVQLLHATEGLDKITAEL
mgnify:FL=1